MAYFLKNQNEDQNQQSGNQNQMSGGNIYSTSGSEVSSSTPTSTSSNSSNSSQSNESGNWVNLNKYLDANQGKVGGYVDNLVKPYTDSASQFRNDLNTASQNQSQNIKDNTLSQNKVTDIVTRYGKDGNSITDDEYKRVSDAVQGNFNVNPFDQNENYTQLSGTITNLNQVGNNLGNQNYLKSLMGNQVSSGGKDLNAFLVGGTQTGKEKINDYSNQFSNLKSYLDQETENLNNLRNNAIQQNKDLATQTIQDLRGKDTVGSSYLNEIKNRGNKEGANDNTASSYYSSERYRVKNPTTGQMETAHLSLPTIYRSQQENAQDYLNRENKEYYDRLDSLLSGSGRLDSKIDNSVTYMGDDAWNLANNRANEVRSFLTLDPTEIDKLPASQQAAVNMMIVGLSQASSPQLKEKVSNVYSDYLNGKINSWDEIYYRLIGRD